MFMWQSIVSLFVASANPLPHVPTEHVTVSGLSSGAFMANQMHVAASSVVKGSVIFAGGPWSCSEGSQMRALTVCMPKPVEVVVPKLVDAVKNAERARLIDPLSNLARQPVFIVHGSKDGVVKPESAGKVAEFMGAFGAHITTKLDLNMGHGFPTVSTGGRCEESRKPWLNSCSYDGAGAALSAMYGPLRPPVRPVKENLIQFSQKEFDPEGKAGLSESGMVYIPSACRQQRCRLHVAFHGCVQNRKAVGGAFVEGTGYNAWAESNGIVVLYPDVQEVRLRNPNGCWDWWGYSGENYALKSAPQVKAILGMIERLH